MYMLRYSRMICNQCGHVVLSDSSSGAISFYFVIFPASGIKFFTLLPHLVYAGCKNPCKLDSNGVWDISKGICSGIPSSTCK